MDGCTNRKLTKYSTSDIFNQYLSEKEFTMKKMIFVVLVILSLVACKEVKAATAKLTCDCSLPADNVTSAQLQFDNGAWIDIPVVATCVGATETVTCTAPAVTICYDTLPNGSHTVKGRFVNIWGPSSDSSPLAFNKATPSGSPTLRVK